MPYVLLANLFKPRQLVINIVHEIIMKMISVLSMMGDTPLSPYSVK